MTIGDTVRLMMEILERGEMRHIEHRKLYNMVGMLLAEQINAEAMAALRQEPYLGVDNPLCIWEMAE